MNSTYDYGLWQVVLLHSSLFLFFVFSFFRPTSRRDWRTFGAFSAFVIALFSEMYGFPLTIYLFSGWLTRIYPDINWFSHDSSHLLQTLLGWEGNAHFAPIHLISNILTLFGLFLLVASWRVLYKARRNMELAVTGPYAIIRHPQYLTFIIMMIGFLIQWPTLPTLLMFPILVVTYVRLAKREEKEAMAEFGEEYARYAAETPRFLPRFRKKKTTPDHFIFDSAHQELVYQEVPINDNWHEKDSFNQSM